MIIGRFYWDKALEFPSPWLSFSTVTAYRVWAREVRKARPRTKTEYEYVDSVWTADTLLREVQRNRRGEPS